MSEEFYPMPLFVRMSVRDVEASARWYAEALGFCSVYAMPGADGQQVVLGGLEPTHKVVVDGNLLLEKILASKD